jgi:predicted short-subunit dehydrogenase-like oxidoreductase (DUF2520 family)
MTRHLAAPANGRVPAPPPGSFPADQHYRVGVVGAGRVGAVLAAALREAGHVVVAASGSSAATRMRLETLLPDLSPQPPAEVARAAQLLLLTVPDDALGALVEELATAGALRPGQVVVHTSGRHGTGVLAAAAEAGALTVALHPAMTFTGTDLDLERLSGCVLGLTAGPRGRAVGERLAADIGAQVVHVPEEQRSRYHAALAHGANHLGTLVVQAMDLLRATGTPDPAAVLRPLLQAALDNSLAYGDAALTGPVVRGDAHTVRAHLAALEDAGPGTRSAYRAMASAAVERAELDGRLSHERGDALRELLAGERAPAPSQAR